jgi:hypothetical protein
LKRLLRLPLFSLLCYNSISRGRSANRRRTNLPPPSGCPANPLASGGGVVVSMVSVKDNDVGDIQRSQQASHRWQTRIERFTREQRSKRDCINFAEIAEWFSDLADPQGSDEIARANAYRKLQQGMLDGDFEQNGRSAVRLLHPRMIRRMQPEYFRSILEIHGEAKIQSDVLPYCWFPFSLFERWCAKHHLPTSPRFQAKQHNASPSKAATYRTGLPGKPTSMHLIRAEFSARAERNETKKTLTQEANALSAWLTTVHPTAPRAGHKTIANALREEFRSLKSKKTQK